MSAVERVTCVYRVRAGADAIEARAQALALEQSVELPLAAVADARIRETVAGRVEAIEPAGDGEAEARAHDRKATGDAIWSVRIGLAASTIGADPGQLLNMLFGNASLQPDVSLVDAQLPARLLSAFPGPAFGVEGLRALAGAGPRPMSCTALKPQGLAPDALAQLAHSFAQAGIDLIKDDHGIADQASAPFAERVPAIQRAVLRANAATGGTSVYAPSVSGGPAAIAQQMRVVRGEGVRCVLACPMVLGVSAFAQLLRAEGDVAIIAHPSLAGLARIAPALLLGKLFRLFGADATIFPNFGGRFSYSRATCQAIARAAREPMGAHRAAMPVPAGGMSVERVEEMVAQFGHDCMLLIGGNLLEAGPAMPERARAFAQAVRRQRAKA